MDVIFPTAWGEFEWDSEKDAINQEKHGLTFSDAVSVFRDPERLDRFDGTHSGLLEDRFRTIGHMGQGIVVMVVNVERSGRLRIISARSATKYEEKLYYGRNRN